MSILVDKRRGLTGQGSGFSAWGQSRCRSQSAGRLLTVKIERELVLESWIYRPYWVKSPLLRTRRLPVFFPQRWARDRQSSQA